MVLGSATIRRWQAPAGSRRPGGAGHCWTGIGRQGSRGQSATRRTARRPSAPTRGWHLGAGWCPAKIRQGGVVPGGIVVRVFSVGCDKVSGWGSVVMVGMFVSACR
ncbi:basic proline-rich protein-like [Iris pallida]|uniref:Basic proline-rich protein-like n=1 Tax=Iris pallida TaxID=29817 RepID=A0AAX6IFB7_IRIPA|nr:basic proline-rich protein-like [Iris pallida]